MLTGLRCFMIFLTETTVVSLSLICSFSRMRGHLGLGEIKAENVSEDTVKAVAETLKKSTTLKISEDGKFTDVMASLSMLCLLNVLSVIDR